MTGRRTIALIVAGGLAAGIVGVAAGRLVRSGHPALERTTFRGEATWRAGAHAAPAITSLRDQRGRAFSLKSLRGHTVAVVFFDSHCTQECPLEGRALAAAEQQLPAAQRPVLVAVSVNPKDTPASVRSAVARWGLTGDERWFWLMGTKAQLSPIWRAYRIFVSIPARGDIVHTEALYLLDRRGFERSAYLYPFEPRFVAHDLRLLAAGRSA